MKLSNIKCGGKGLTVKYWCRILLIHRPNFGGCGFASADVCFKLLEELVLNVWSEINRRMRRQKRHYPVNKKETRDQYLARLRRTAMRLPEKFLKASIINLKVRSQRLYEAKGEHIEEGRCR